MDTQGKWTTTARHGVRLLGELVYSALPFIVLLMTWDAYLKDPKQTYYTPDFPNSMTTSTTTALDGSVSDLGVTFYDLAQFESTSTGWQNEERILFLVPLRDASAHLPMFFGHLKNMTYPHHLIDLSFLISDTSDSTLTDLQAYLEELQNSDNKYGRIEIYEKDFGQIVGQSFSDRHGFAAQGPRRKLMAIARNWLLTTALKPDHSWVYWRDIDVETAPATILEDLMHHDKDVIVPNIWRPLPDWLNYEQAYDLNSWQESEGGIELAERLDEDAVIVEGYPEYATWRPHLAYLRDPYGDPEVEMELDGIGGVSILAKAHVFRRGGMFPAFSFKKHAETEAFGKLCKTMEFQVVGLPHYVIWHIYEPSTDDLKHMEWLANEEVRRSEMLKNKEFYDKAWASAFEDVNSKWAEEKFNVYKNNDLSKLSIGYVDWNEVDEYLTEVDEDDDDDNVDQFLFNFETVKESKQWEQKILQELNPGGRRYGKYRYEILFDDFNNVDGSNKPKKKKFKKFTKPAVDFEEGVDESEGIYDFKSDKVVDQKFKLKDVTEERLDQDKQLFDALEGEIDEDEGVEFKEQKRIEDLQPKKKKDTGKTKKASKAKKKVTKQQVRTLYEVDDAGITIATILHTMKPKPTRAPVLDLELD